MIVITLDLVRNLGLRKCLEWDAEEAWWAIHGILFF